MTNGSTTIAGREISDLCMRYAGMLNLDIYDTQANLVAPELRAQFDLNKRYWEKLWEIDKSDSGFKCAFYAPRDARKKDRASVCPPALVFRGSDSEPKDFAEMASAMRLRINYNVDAPWPASDVVGVFNLDRSFSSTPAYHGKTMAQLDASGLTKESLFAGTTGRTTYTIDGPMAFNVDIALDWSLDAALYFGGNGDWAVNFAQGLGRQTSQYTDAIAAGKRAAIEAHADWNKRLIITGHSLGGGLASAAAIAARIEKPDLRIRSTTYNAAGLHANTARQAGGTRATAGDVPVRAVHVKDEILNSMQATSRMVPFLSDLLVWGNKTMPSAIANASPSPGVSPGTMPISGKTYAAKLAALPVLFTLDRQKLGPAVTVLGEILAIANRSATAPPFVNDLIVFLLNQLTNNGNASFGDLQELGGLATAMNIPNNFATQIQDAILKDGPVPQVTVTGGNIARRAQPLFNALLQDIVTLGRVMLASGEYHTMPPVAFTFLMPPA
jgi:pimeloyl-ACP methyl ester carboxylesterase